MDSSVSCEMPFEAHGRGVSLRSAYWRRGEEHWRSDSFRNLEGDRLFTEPESYDAKDTYLMNHVANMWTIEPPLATKTGRNGRPNGAVEIGWLAQYRKFSYHRKTSWLVLQVLKRRL